MSEALLIFCTDEELGALQHLLYHHSRGTLDLHHAVVFQRQMFRCPDVQGNATYITLMDRSYHLSDNGIPHLLGEGDELVFRRAHQFRHQRNTGTGENVAYGLRWHVTILLDAHDDLVESGYVDAVELHLRRCWHGRLHDL